MAFKRRPPKGNYRLVRSNGKNERRFCLNKEWETFQCESRSEYAHALNLLRDVTVVNFWSQSIKFEIQDANNKLRTYIPDYLVLRDDGHYEIHEVTTADRQRTRLEIQRREKFARRICEHDGYVFRTFIENQIPQLTEFANLDVLFGFIAEANKCEISANAIIHEIPKDGQRVKIRPFLTKIAKQHNVKYGTVARTCKYLLWYQYLCFDINQLLLVDSKFSDAIEIWYEEA